MVVGRKSAPADADLGAAGEEALDRDSGSAEIHDQRIHRSFERWGRGVWWPSRYRSRFGQRGAFVCTSLSGLLYFCSFSLPQWASTSGSIMPRRMAPING